MRGTVCVGAMTLLETWLQPLRAYPPGWVLAVFVVTAGGVAWLIAKMLKWIVYVLALVIFATATGALALWLWA